MPYVAQYLLKLSISLSVVYLFYALVLRRLTFYTWNRWYLLGYSLLAFFIPFVNISPMLEQGTWHDNKVVQLIPVVGNYNMPETTASRGVDGWTIACFLLLAGAAVMLIRLLIQYASFLRIRRSSQLLSDNIVKIYQVNKHIIPFSFGRSIFINQHQHNEEELREIIRHEFIHVKQRHTVDILWGELLCMLNWYNPFAWLIRKSIRQNLEFIADHQVLKTGLDRKQYQYLLLKVVGVPAFAITNQFNFSSLKKRIVMMNKMRSAKLHLIKFLFVLPLVTVLLLAFRSAAINKEDIVSEPEKKVNKKNNPMDRIEEKIMTGGGQPVRLPRRDTVPIRIKAVLVGTDSVHGTNIIAVRDTSRFFMDASLHGPGNPNFSIRRSVHPLVIIDGVEEIEGEAGLQKLNPADIESISILKDKDAGALYGEKAKGGAMIITTKKGKIVPPAPVLPLKDTVPANPRSQIKVGGNGVTLGHFSGVIVLDGVILDSQDTRRIDLKLQPGDIQSIEVLKGPGAEAIYGPKGKSGVIKITSKKSDQRITHAPSSRQQAFAAFRPITRPPAQVSGKPLIPEARQEANEPF